MAGKANDGGALNFETVVSAFRQAGVEICELSVDGSRVATIAAAGRIVAFASETDDRNFLWNPAEILDPFAFSTNLFCCPGAPGGDRLWIAPEYAHHRLPNSAEERALFNGNVPYAEDPGPYQMSKFGKQMVWSGELTLENFHHNVETKLSIRRQVAPIGSAISICGVSSAAYRITQTAHVSGPVAGLWNIAQVPAGAVLIVPLNTRLQANGELTRNYFKPATTKISDNAVAFYSNGSSCSKIGISAQYVTGRSAAFYRQGSELVMLMRENDVDSEGYYCDGVSPNQPKNQIVQCWDGFGFAELEYHSSAAGALTGQSVIEDCSVLTGVRGAEAAVLKIASEQLGLHRSELSNLI